MSEYQMKGTPMSGLRISRLSKSFGTYSVIEDFSLQVAPGEFCALVGPSGCGKSTILRIVAGLERPTSGEICIGTAQVTHLPPSRRDIAMVFQNYALYPHMTVAENIGFPLKMRGDSADQRREQVLRAAKTVSMDGYLDRHPKQLSGGQRQRVAMARSLVRNPKLFLFDEPLSNLDAKLRVEMRTQIKELQQDLGTTTLYVTHDQVEAMTMADRIIVLRAGKIEQAGAPLELYDKPATPFVARFIGSPSMNMFSGKIQDGGLFVTDAGTALPLPIQLPDRRENMLYGIRPEDIDILPAADNDGVDAEIVTVEPTGSESVVVVRFANQTVTITTRERVVFKHGDRVSIRPRRERVHLFSNETRVS